MSVDQRFIDNIISDKLKHFNLSHKISEIDSSEKKDALTLEKKSGAKIRRPFPYVIRDVDPEINHELLEHFTGEKTGFVQVGPKEWFFPSKYKYQAENFYNFEVRKNDVWIITFPRSGTTWTQEMVWLLANDLDYSTAAKVPLTNRFPFFEFSIFVHDETKKQFLQENKHDTKKMAMIENLSISALKYLDQMQERRFIKTHLPFSLLPPDILNKGCKVIYLARNPKDVAVSFYHLNRSIRTQGYVGDFPKYWDYFERNLQPWTPYWEHVKEGWTRRNHPNLLFMFYEDMNENLSCCIEKVSNFLGKKYNEEEICELKNHLKIDNFRKNKSVNNDLLKSLGLYKQQEEGYVRKGKTGGWKEYFTDGLNERANKWILENLKTTDLTFPRQSEILF